MRPGFQRIVRLSSCQVFHHIEAPCGLERTTSSTQRLPKPMCACISPAGVNFFACVAHGHFLRSAQRIRESGCEKSRLPMSSIPTLPFRQETVRLSLAATNYTREVNLRRFWDMVLFVTMHTALAIWKERVSRRVRRCYAMLPSVALGRAGPNPCPQEPILTLFTGAQRRFGWCR